MKLRNEFGEYLYLNGKREKFQSIVESIKGKVQQLKYSNHKISKRIKDKKKDIRLKREFNEYKIKQGKRGEIHFELGKVFQLYVIHRPSYHGCKFTVVEIKVL